ncbi:MAG: ATP-binding protein [Treponema sp.]|nr:ATP-binding protein [Treponema sp.]
MLRYVMAVKVTSLTEWNIEKIVKEIDQNNIKAVIYFFSPSYIEYNLHEEIANAFPAAVCAGASMYGGWSSSGGAIKNGITLMSLSGDEVENIYITFQEGVKKDPTQTALNAINDLKIKTDGNNINPDEYLGLIFFDGLCLGELIIKEFTMEKYLNMGFVGGAAADETTFTKTYITAGKKLSDDGLIAVILKMKIPFFFNYNVHYLPTEKSFLITSVETKRRIAWTINGETAADFYAKQLGLNDAGKLTKEIFAKNPIGLLLGDSVYIRSPNKVVEGGGLQFYCSIEAGTKVYLLQQGDIIANAKESITAASQFLPGIQGCLLFNCLQRYIELIEREKIDEFNSAFSVFPMAGFNTYGEELFTHHNQTLTAVFFGTIPETGMTDPYKTKRLFHYTNSKLKSLVFDIVSRSELLNMTISYLKGTMDSETNESALSNLETIRKSFGAMIEQSNISKKDIERMLVVYQNNVEKTGEYVFSIVDEIKAQNSRLVELREDAELATRTKSSFLAGMSHEIRTPMNAIAGMTELLIRTDLNDEARGYAQEIKQAGNNLISIINDILDFSKIEAGRMELISIKYLLASLINDTVNIIRTRLRNKQIRFFTNIDSQIPNSLIGDEIRIRQILLNLLTNAVKFTDKGHISLSITMRKLSDNKIWLDFVIEDTGKGITEEDQKKLFNEFVQVDSNRNRNIEGTGLGLAITKRLCTLMGGNISLESVYGKGSAFKVSIPQEIDSNLPFAAVENPQEKKVLVYEGRLIYGNSVCWSLKNMGVPYTMVTTIDDFAKAVFKDNWTLVLSGYGLHDRINSVMNRPDKEYHGGKRPPVALMIEWGTEAYIPNVRFVSLPVQSLSIANILNGKEEVKSLTDVSGSNLIRHVYPAARVLVVDDIKTNLKVAEGLMTPYKFHIDTCLSGPEAIDLIKCFNYDICFMDHMMPGMNGIEATALIREWEKEKNKTETAGSKTRLTIIALTANAVFGVRDMFIENGFDDFIGKPVDITELDEILNKWIPKEKKERKAKNIIHDEQNNDLPEIKDIDVKKGITMTGGTEEGYYNVLSIFKKDALERIPALMSYNKNISAFTTNIHALKSAAASIGAEKISDYALKLENAGRENDINFIKANVKIFIAYLTSLLDNITQAIKDRNDVISKDDKAEEESGDLNILLKELITALETKKTVNIDSVLEKIYHLNLSDNSRYRIDEISDNILIAEFDAAKKMAEKMTNNN